MADRLRISGGSHRGRRLFSPPKNSIRPASDLVRQAVFNMLSGVVEGSVFLDVFAGTGIVGLEALSRGAARAVFIERDRRQIDLIRKNLERTGLTARAVLRGSDAFLWARHFVPDPRPTIVFLGPPYPDFDSDRKRMLELVEELQGKLKAGDWLVFQFPRFVKEDELPRAEAWRRVRTYGKTRIGIWRAGDEDAPDAGEPALDEAGAEDEPADGSLADG